MIDDFSALAQRQINHASNVAPIPLCKDDDLLLECAVLWDWTPSSGATQIRRDVDRQIKEPGPGGHVCHVGYPQRFGAVSAELTFDQNVSRLGTLVTGCTPREAPAMANYSNACHARQTRHTLTTNALAPSVDLSSTARHALGLVGFLTNLTDALGHHGIVDASL